MYKKAEIYVASIVFDGQRQPTSVLRVLDWSQIDNFSVAELNSDYQQHG